MRSWVQIADRADNAKSPFYSSGSGMMAIAFLKCGLLVSMIKSNGYTAPLSNTEVIGPRLTWMRDYLGTPAVAIFRKT